MNLVLRIPCLLVSRERRLSSTLSSRSCHIFGACYFLIFLELPVSFVFLVAIVSWALLVVWVAVAAIVIAIEIIAVWLVVFVSGPVAIMKAQIIGRLVQICVFADILRWKAR